MVTAVDFPPMFPLLANRPHGEVARHGNGFWRPVKSVGMPPVELWL